MDAQGHAGQEERLPHTVELFIRQPPGIIVVSGEGRRLAEQGRHPCPLVPVAVREYKFLLAEIPVFHQFLLKILQFQVPFHKIASLIFPIITSDDTTFLFISQATIIDFLSACAMIRLSNLI